MFSFKGITLGLFILLMTMATPLVASGGGGYGGGGGKTKTDKDYTLGQQVFTKRARLSGFKATVFKIQIRSIEQAVQALESRGRNGSHLLNMAGRLSDAQYKGLQKLLDKRYRITLPAAKSDADYAFATRWIWQPGVGYETTDPTQQTATTSDKDSDELDQQRVKHQTILIQLVTDTLRLNGASRKVYDRPEYLEQAGRLSDQQVAGLRHYLNIRYGIRTETMTEELYTTFKLGQTMTELEGIAELTEKSSLRGQELVKQRTFLRELERKLPKGSLKISKWAGRLSDEHWNALLVYAKQRHGLMPRIS